MIYGDKAKIEVDVATNMEIKTSIQDFLILEHDAEPLESHGSLMEFVVSREKLWWSTRLVNIDTFGTPKANPLNAIEDNAEEDKILDDANLDVYPKHQKKNRKLIINFFTMIFRTKTRSSQ